MKLHNKKNKLTAWRLTQKREPTINTTKNSDAEVSTLSAVIVMQSNNTCYKRICHRVGTPGSVLIVANILPKVQLDFCPSTPLYMAEKLEN